jgi:hypothetical protein
MNAADIAVALGDARREGRAWRCRCAFHNRLRRTLRDGDGVVTCSSGCGRPDLPNGRGEAYSMDAPSVIGRPPRSFTKTHELWRAGGWWIVREHRRTSGKRGAGASG